MSQDMDPDAAAWARDDPMWQELMTAGEVAPPSADVLAEAAAVVRRSAVTETLATSVLRARRARRRRRRVVAGLAVATTAAALVVPTIPVGTERPPASASAAQFLTHAASQVEDAPAPDSRYLRVEYQSASIFNSRGVIRADYRLRPFERVTVWYSRAGTATYLSRRNSAPVATRTGLSSTAKPFPLGTDMDLSWQDVLRLPTDARLLSKMFDRAGGQRGADPASIQFSFIIDLLSGAPLAGSQRRALLTVASELPNAKLLGPMADADGRAGTGVEVSASGESTILIVDAHGVPLEKTLRLAASRTIAPQEWPQGVGGGGRTVEAPGPSPSRATFGVGDPDGERLRSPQQIVPAGTVLSRTTYTGVAGVDEVR